MYSIDMYISNHPIVEITQVKYYIHTYGQVFVPQCKHSNKIQ